MTKIKKYSSLDHASHNAGLCQTLHEMKKYPDWVVTLAFYSCLHFLRHKIFPFKKRVVGKAVKVKTFDSYCKSIGETGKKHSIMKKLVQEKCSRDVYINYARLLDLSYTARYKQYQISERLADESVNYLRKIEDYAKA